MASLQDLARQIKSEHKASVAAANRSTKHARIAGRLLLDAKKRLAQHGKWLPWLRDHCKLSVRTAQAYMRLAKLSPAKAQRVAPLALREALRTVATPKKEAKLKETFQILIVCKGEADQTVLLDRLTKEGHQCRALIS
jgi:DUF3102 family protein